MNEGTLCVRLNLTTEALGKNAQWFPAREGKAREAFHGASPSSSMAWRTSPPPCLATSAQPLKYHLLFTITFSAISYISICYSTTLGGLFDTTSLTLCLFPPKYSHIFFFLWTLQLFDSTMIHGLQLISSSAHKFSEQNTGVILPSFLIEPHSKLIIFILSSSLLKLWGNSFFCVLLCLTKYTDTPVIVV